MSDNQTPMVLNDDVAPAPPQPPKRTRKEAEPSADLIARLKEELRAEMVAEQASAAGSVKPQRTGFTYPDGVVAEFWTASKAHNPMVKRPYGDGFIRFSEGYYAARNETDAQLIRDHLQGMAWERDWPDGIDRPRDPVTGFSPGAWGAWQAFQQWIGAFEPN